MARWIILLRGVNVGGHNKLPMADFRDLLTRLGFRDVATYIQSGNAVLSTDDTVMPATISDAIEERFGFSVDVFSLRREWFEKALAENPFPQALDDPKTLHLVFIGIGQQSFEAADLAVFATNGEEFRIKDGIIYLFTPNGYGRSKLAEKLPRMIKTTYTARNLRSCLKIAELASATA